ncbi:MAG: hypothetical protein ACTSYD_11820 [Candidatus Heimdallarchaeaceae archaeon]
MNAKDKNKYNILGVIVYEKNLKEGIFFQNPIKPIPNEIRRKIESNKIFETQGLEGLEKLKKINQDLNALIKRATNELQEEKVVTTILENIRQKN